MAALVTLFVLTAGASAQAAHPEGAEFSWYPDRPLVGQTVELYGYSDNFEDVRTYDLDENGICETTETDLETDPLVFSTAGDKVVKMCVTADGLDPTIVTRTIHVHGVNREPEAEFWVYDSSVGYYDDYRVREDAPVYLSSSAYDPDGLWTDTITYAWDFDDDGVYGDDVGAGDGGTDQYPVHTFATAGTTEVGLQVTSQGQTSYTRHAVQVVSENRQPYVSFYAWPDETIGVNESVELDAYAWDPEGTITEYAWDLDGDGSFEVVDTATDVSPPVKNVSFGTAGDKTVRFRATDDEGATTTEVVVLHVARPSGAPGVYIDVYPTDARVGQSVEFNAFTGSFGTATYAWDLDGDGQYDDSTLPYTTQTYGTAGDRLISVRVTIAGESTIASQVLHVHTTNDNPSVDFGLDSGTNGYCGYYSGCSRRVLEDRLVTYYSNSWDSDGQVDQLTWEFGDGTAPVVVTGTGGGPPDWTTTHTYASPGHFMASLEAEDDASGVGRSEYSVHVHSTNEPPDVTTYDYDGYYGTGNQVDLYAYAIDDGAVASFEWDLDEDGQYDDATGDIVENHVFANEGDNIIAVRVTDDLGATSIDKRSVHVHFDTAVAPVGVNPPTITGTAAEGSTLTAHNGDWNGTNPMTFSYQWLRCTSTDIASCTNIASATNSTYQLTATDVDKYIRVKETATNGSGSAQQTSAATGPIATAPPVNTVLPVVSGTLTDGHFVSGTNGTWTGSPSFTYQWLRCTTTDIADCSNIPSATSNSYRLTTADVGNRVRLRVTATNGAGNTAATSEASGVIAAGPPVNTVAPVISGTLTDGSTLSTTNGTWVAAGTTTYTYQWQRCTSAALNTCTPIGGATNSTYPLTPDDIGKYMVVLVTATDGDGASLPAASNFAGPVAGAPPANTSLPGITGTPTDGQTLTSTTGSWTGSPTITYARQWLRCTDTTVGSCSEIGGATGTTYQLTPADIGKYIRVRVTGTSTYGNASATSNPTAIVAASPPVNTALPTVTGTTQNDELLTASNGTWTGSPTITFAYQWLRCDSSGANCSNINGATASTYALTTTDVGSTIRVRVTATNGGGSTPAESAQTAVVTGVPPVNTSLPTIDDTTPQDAQLLTAGAGTWSGGPTFGYQWLRCTGTDVGTCSEIGGATGNTYTTTGTDIGQYLRVRVTGTNDYGNAAATSAATSLVTAAPPVNSIAPVVSGTATDGETLSTTDGSWTGTPTITFTYAWLRCTGTDVGTCSTISGATGSSYQLTPADIGNRIRSRVTGTNAGGNSSATSNASAVVAAIPVANTGLPTVTGTARDVETLGSTNGTWTGSPTISFGYQWLRCTDDTIGTCSPISGATAANYAVTPADVGNRLRIRVTGTNAANSVAATSEPTAVVVAAPPANTAKPTVTGTATDGETLASTTGSWTGTPTIEFARQWLRCDGGTCDAIGGATGASYTLTAADVGKRIAVRVTATNAVGSASADSDPTGVVAAKTVVTDPVVTPTPDPVIVNPPDPGAEEKGLATAIDRLLDKLLNAGGKVDAKNPVLQLGQIGPAECPQGCLVSMLVQLAGAKASGAQAAALVKLGSGKVTVAKGGSAKLKVKLNKKAKAILRKKKKLKAKVTLTLSNPSTGAKQTDVRSVTVKARKK